MCVRWTRRHPSDWSDLSDRLAPSDLSGPSDLSDRPVPSAPLNLFRALACVRFRYRFSVNPPSWRKVRPWLSIWRLSR